MDDVLNWLWQGGVIAVATMLVLQLLERSRSRDRYALCWIALLAVLALPVISRVGISDSPGPVLLNAEAPGAPVLVVPSAWWTSGTVAIAMWTLWVAVHVVRFAAAVLAIRRVKRRASPFPTALESRLRCWKQVGNSGRRTRLVVTSGVKSAAVLGWGSPVIAVSPALLQHVSVDEIDRIVIHEWAHVQHRDDLLNHVRLVAHATAGWHPAVWWLDRQLQIEREAACDETAVSVTGCAKSYAACLTNIASLFPGRRQAIPVLGAVSSPGLAGRVVRILSQKRLFSATWSTGTTVAAILSLCVLSGAIAGLSMIEMAAASSHLERIQDAALTDIDENGSAVSRLELPFVTRLLDAGIIEQPRLRSRPGRPSRVAPRRAVPGPPATPTRPPEPQSAAQSSRDEPTAPVDSASMTNIDPVDGTARTLPLVAPHDLLSMQPAADAPAPSLRSATAAASIAVGQGTQRAALATAGFFNRFGRKIAGSF